MGGGQCVCEGTDVAVAVGVRPRVVVNLSLLNVLFIGDHEISPTVPHHFLRRRELWEQPPAGGLLLPEVLVTLPYLPPADQSLIRHIFVSPMT